METLTNRALSVLFITEYSSSNVNKNWKKVVDTIINNLLDKEADGTFIKYTGLPEILVSIVEIAETQAQAMKMLQESKYDVVFVNNNMEGRPIMSGALKRYRTVLPNALYIPLLSIEQKCGQRKRDNTISDGRGVLNLYTSEFYSGIYKNKINLAEIIKLILAGGRKKEDAFEYYGLNLAGNSLEQKDTARAERIPVKDDNVSSSSSVDEKNGKENNITSSAPIHSGDDTRNIIFELSEKLDKLPVKDIKSILENAGGEVEKVNRYIPQYLEMEEEIKNPVGWFKAKFHKEDREKKAAEKRRMEEQRLAEEQARMEAQEFESASFERKEEESGSDYESTKQEFINMLPSIKKRFSEGSAMRGAMVGRVIHLQGNFACIELAKSVDEYGVEINDVAEFMVQIPYLKFKE